MRYKKGQSAIEYLMNYAWAIALIIIVGAAIYGLNIGGIKNSLAGQGTDLQTSSAVVSVTGKQYNTSSLVVSFQNNGANKIVFNNANISQVDGTIVTQVVACIPSTTTLYPGETATNCQIAINMSLIKTAGQPYTVKLVTNYTDNVSGIVYTPTQTIQGIVA